LSIVAIFSFGGGGAAIFDDPDFEDWVAGLGTGAAALGGGGGGASFARVEAAGLEAGGGAAARGAVAEGVGGGAPGPPVLERLPNIDNAYLLLAQKFPEQ
jgi:hypothetical protein